MEQNLLVVHPEQVICKGNSIFNLPTICNGAGKVVFGNNFMSGYSLAPHFHGFHNLLQARYVDSLLEIGNNVKFSNDITLIAARKICIGDNCLIGDRVTIMDHDGHGVEPDKRTSSIGECSSVFIGKNVWIGSGALILRGVHIGDNAIVAAQSIVVKNVEANTIVAGNPARFVKNL